MLMCRENSSTIYEGTYIKGGGIKSSYHLMTELHKEFRQREFYGKKNI